MLKLCIGLNEIWHWVYRNWVGRCGLDASGSR